MRRLHGCTPCPRQVRLPCCAWGAPPISGQLQRALAGVQQAQRPAAVHDRGRLAASVRATTSRCACRPAGSQWAQGNSRLAELVAIADTEAGGGLEEARHWMLRELDVYRCVRCCNRNSALWQALHKPSAAAWQGCQGWPAVRGAAGARPRSASCATPCNTPGFCFVLQPDGGHIYPRGVRCHGPRLLLAAQRAGHDRCAAHAACAGHDAHALPAMLAMLLLGQSPRTQSAVWPGRHAWAQPARNPSLPPLHGSPSFHLQ